MTSTLQPLAPYAVTEAAAKARQHKEPLEAAEPPFEVDRDRILNSMAFRRLRHKTQVFLPDFGDHFRTRMTHTLEVQIQAERLSRLLQLNDRLAGAIALAHDLGHPPFGHAGEVELADLMKDHGGFEHNVQSLRIVDYLEHPYPDFRGLNLSFELRESLIKHRTRYDRPDAAPADPANQPLLDTGPQPPLEGQVANLADVIAYTLHDIEDGLVENVIDERVLSASRLWCEASAPTRLRHPSTPIAAVRRPILDEIACRLHADASAESRRRIADAGVHTVDDVRRTPNDLIGFSPEMKSAFDELQGVLHQAVYRNHRVVRMDAKARRLIRDLFDAYLAQPELLPERYAGRIGEQGVYRVICDYTAGMTDRFCQEEHRQLFAPFHFG